MASTPTPRRGAGAGGGRRPSAPRVEETSAGGFVLDRRDRQAKAALIARRDRRGRLVWSLPKGHIESGETPEDAAVREIFEETGIRGRIVASLGTIDFWFMADQQRIHKTVHHYLLDAQGGALSDADAEVAEVAWVPLDEVATRLRYADERRLVERVRAVLADPTLPTPVVDPAHEAPLGACVRARRLVAGLGLGLGLLLAATPVAHSRAVTAPRAEDPAPSVRVVIDELAPVVPEEGDVLRVRGRVISTARVPITDVAVQLRRSSSAVPSRAGLAAAAAAPLVPETGEPADVPLPGTRVVVADELPPDGRRTFSIRVPLESLGLPAPGTYVLGVEAIGREAGVDEFDARKGMLRTFLPWVPRGTDIDPLDVVWLWPLADWPARGSDGVLLDDQTPTELSPGGRLDQLLQVGARFTRTVSWLADPALLQTAADMSDGYQVRQDGAVAVGDREQQAQRWLDGLAEATRGQDLRTLPYADVDASAVTRAGMPTDVVRAVTQAPGIAAAALGRTVSGDLYWAPFGRIDRPALDVLSSSGVTTLVLSSDAMPATDEATSTAGLATTALPTDVGTIRTVLTDPVLSGLVSAPARSASDVITARQRFLAETAVLAQTLPPDQSMRAVVVAPASVRWTATDALVSPLLRAVGTAPWMRPRALTRLLEQPVPSTSRQRGGYGPKARAAELSPRYMARVARVSDDLDAFTSIIDDPTGISEPFAEALLRAESSGWRSEPEVGEQLLTSIEDSLAAETARVRVLTEGTITFSGDVGRVPVTIVNELDRSVTVGVTLRGSPALRLSSEPLTGIRIEAGKLASVDIDARVVGGDPLDVAVQLIGPEDQDYGEPARITVTSTAYARAAAGVVTVAFVAIAVFVVVGIVRRIRKARRASGTVGA